MSSSERAGQIVTLVGLLLQLGAVLAILVRAGAIRETWTATKRTAAAAQRKASLLLDKLPWRDEATTLELGSNDTSLTLSGTGSESHALLDIETPLASLDHARAELNVLRRRWTELDDRVTANATKAQKEVESAKVEAAKLVREVEATRKERDRRAIRERRWEGFALLVGFVFQIVGIGIVLLWA